MWGYVIRGAVEEGKAVTVGMDFTGYKQVKREKKPLCTKAEIYSGTTTRLEAR